MCCVTGYVLLKVGEKSKQTKIVFLNIQDRSSSVCETWKNAARTKTRKVWVRLVPVGGGGGAMRGSYEKLET